MREIASACGFASPSTALFHLRKLERAGLVARAPRSSRTAVLADAREARAALVPVVGVIRAGEPVLAEQHIEEYVAVPAALAEDESFVLRVRGDSMSGAGILDGDYVLVRRSSTIEPGEIGAFLIGSEATVKRFALRDGRPVLLPENPAYEPIAPDELVVLGRVRYLMRTY